MQTHARKLLVIIAEAALEKSGAKAARAAFVGMPKEDRRALVRFVESL